MHLLCWQIGSFDPLDEDSSSSSSDSESPVLKQEDSDYDVEDVKTPNLNDSRLKRRTRRTATKRYASRKSPSPTQARKKMKRVRKSEAGDETKPPKGEGGTKKRKEKLEKSCPVCFTPVSNSDYEAHFAESHPEVQQRPDPVHRNLMECPKCEYVVKKFERRFIDINR